jgi:hypothetical protein
MEVLDSRWRRLILRAVLCLICPTLLIASDQPAAKDQALSKEQIKEFLLTANVVASKQSSQGVTSTLRLTLSDGMVTHDASFQTVDEHRHLVEFANGQKEGNFVDTYQYNIAAYQLAEMLGVDDMLPVYVERKWKGHTGSLSWWLPVQMDEAERLKKKVDVPNKEAWNNQIYRIRVFDELVYDTDPNLTNVLIGTDWKLYRIDFTRAFRPYKDVQNPAKLMRCDRKLLEKLKALDGNELQQRTKGYLNKSAVQAVMARRDKIIAHFQKLIAEKGENEVLY